MFKHVELMRKVAFKIMHKTFGGKSKEANEAIYDAYPLKDLIRLLCFEDADEARTACQHYNITVKNMKVKTSRGTSVEEIIFWKQTAFREPKDPEKGTLIPLSPRKMLKNIESKLGGATRLAVCRGEVSGEGAFLTNISPRKGATFSSPQAAADNSTLAEERAAALRSMQQREQDRRQRDVMKSKEEEDERLREEESMRDNAEQQQLVEAARMRKIETQEKQQLELQRQQEREEQDRILREQQKLELEHRRLEMERESARKKAEEEQKRKLELERQEAVRRKKERMIREQEEQRRRDEENKRRQEEMAKRLQAEEEVRRVRQAEEARRLAELRHREEEERKRRDAEVRREELEWRAKIDAARKHLLWLRWEQELPWHLRMMEPIEASLRRIDPTIKLGLLVEAFADRVALLPDSSLAQQGKEHRTDVRRVVERLLGQEPDKKIDFASLVAKRTDDYANSRGNEKTTLLFKIAVVLPVSTNEHVQSLCNLIHTWIDSRLDYDIIRSEQSGDSEIRVVTVDGTFDENLDTCDAVMAVICPPWSRSNAGMSSVSDSLSNMASRIGNSVPRTVLILGEDFEPSFIESRTLSIVDIFLGSFGSISISSNTDLTEEATEGALLSSCETLTSMLVNEIPLGLERISVGRLALKCISDLIWQDRLLERRDDILEHARAGLHCMVDEFESLRSDCKSDWQWPAADFAIDGSTIPDYFGMGEGLPLDWISSLSRAELSPAVSTILSALAGPLPEVVERLILGAPYDVKQKVESLLDRRLFRRCLQSALLWNESNQAKQAKYFLYLPRGVLEDTVRSTVVRLQERFVGLLEPSVTDTVADNHTFGSDRTIEGSPLRLPLVPTRAWEDTAVLSISKRPRSELSNPIGNRSLETHRQETTTPKRRRRDLQSSFQPYSRDQEESSAFSRKLDALLSGSNVQDMMVGDETLSALLRGAPSLVRPTKDYLS